MAETISRLVPSCEMVRMVNSGTEATLSAIRLARGATGRVADRQVRGLLPRPRRQLPGQGRQRRADLGRADFAGRAQGAGRPDPDPALQRLRGRHAHCSTQLGDDIAGLIIEPVVGNANCLPPRDGYLQHLRALCTRHGALLIFDEVMTGFRVALGGAQARYGVTPGPDHLRQDHRRRHAGRRLRRAARPDGSRSRPAGPIYQAGTLSGNPVAMAAGPGHAGAGPGAGLPRRLWSAPPHACATGWKPPRARPACRSRPTAWAACSGCSSAPSAWTPTPRRSPATRSIQSLLPRDAGARRLPGAVGLRSRLHVVRA